MSGQGTGGGGPIILKNSIGIEIEVFEDDPIYQHLKERFENKSDPPEIPPGGTEPG